MATQAKSPPKTGTFCWNEVLTTDVAKARKFYTGLLGWTAREMNMGPGGTYTIFTHQGKDVAGCMKSPQPGASPAWLAHLAVDDCESATRKAETLGAKVSVPPTDIPGIGRFSVITDPTGATVGLFQGAM